MWVFVTQIQTLKEGMGLGDAQDSRFDRVEKGLAANEVVAFLVERQEEATAPNLYLHQDSLADIAEVYSYTLQLVFDLPSIDVVRRVRVDYRIRSQGLLALQAGTFRDNCKFLLFLCIRCLLSGFVRCLVSQLCSQYLVAIAQKERLGRRGIPVR